MSVRPAGWWDRAWPGHPRTWHGLVRRLLPTAGNILRLTVAAVLAYLLTVVWTQGPLDLTGALTAMLVVQATSYSTVQMGAVRIGAVLVGVLVAIGVSSLVGLTWWSLALAVSSSLLLARMFRLGPQALEAPISAMLVLAVGGAEIAAETRVLTTLIGAGVGVVFVVLVPPYLPTPSAAAAVRRVADGTADALERAGDVLADKPLLRADLESWIDAMEEVRSLVGEASAQVSRLRDARVMNPRALRSSDRQDLLATALDSLDKTVLTIRALFRVAWREAPVHETPDDSLGDEVRAAFVEVLRRLADGVRRFGALVEAEVDGEVEDAGRSLADALAEVREAQGRLTGLMMVDPRAEPHLWLVRGTVLTAIDQVIATLDAEERARVRQRSWRLSPLERFGRSAPVVRRRRAGEDASGGGDEAP